MKLEIYGADITESAPALYFCDYTVIVPRIKDSNYIPKLQKICKEKKIDALIPTIDELGGIQYRKPNKKAFELMQNRWKIAFNKMVYIGDNVTKDFIAPKELGMKVVYFKNADGLYYVD